MDKRDRLKDPYAPSQTDDARAIGVDDKPVYPLSPEDEERSLHLTGSTAASDVHFYLDQVKNQNNE